MSRGAMVSPADLAQWLWEVEVATEATGLVVDIGPDHTLLVLDQYGDGDVIAERSVVSGP